MGMDNQWTCRCGQVNKKNFCINCGGKKETHQVVEQPSIPDDSWMCECGSVNAIGSAFCVHCGKSKEQVLNDSWHCSCGKINQADDRYCSACGTIKPGVEDNHWFCRKCGEKNEAAFCFSCGASKSGENVMDRTKPEAECKDVEEAAHKEAERKAAEEAAHKEAERKAAEEAAHREAERKAADEAARKKVEHKAEEEATRGEAEKQPVYKGPIETVKETSATVDYGDLPLKKGGKKGIIIGVVAVLLIALIGFGLMSKSGSDSQDVNPTTVQTDSKQDEVKDKKSEGDTAAQLQAKYKQDLEAQNTQLKKAADDGGKVVFIPESLEKVSDSTLKMTGHFYNGKGVVKKIDKVMLDLSLMDAKGTTSTSSGIICPITGLSDISLGQGSRTNSVSFEIPINTTNISFDHFAVTSSKVAAGR